jgi:HEAT repeat protein
MMSFLQGLFGPPDSKKLEANIEKLKAKRDVKGLIKALSYQKDYKVSVHKWAVEALGEIGDARAVEPLIVVLKDDQFDEGRLASDALCKIGAPAVEPLIAALKDGKSYFVFRNAAESLGCIGDTRAVEPLIAALKDTEYKYACSALVNALGKLGDARAVEPLITALKDDDEVVRWQAAKALGMIGDARAVEPLVATLKDGDSGVCSSAAVSLGKFGDARAVPTLILATYDSNLGIAAFKALGMIGDSSVIDPLILSLCGDIDRRKAAAEALVNLYHKKNIDAKSKQKILEKRADIISPHSDDSAGDDCAGAHHGDRGIGVDFPL